MTTIMPPLRILIADDHDVMREGTRAVIERQPGWDVCGVAATAVRPSSRPLRSSPTFIFKSEAHHFLVEAIQSLSQHKPFFTNKVAEMLFESSCSRKPLELGTALPLSYQPAPGERF